MAGGAGWRGAAHAVFQYDQLRFIAALAGQGLALGHCRCWPLLTTNGRLRRIPAPAGPVCRHRYALLRAAEPPSLAVARSGGIV